MKAAIQTCIFTVLCILSVFFAAAQCPPGKYGPPCKNCPAGSYCPGDGNSYLCPGGTYQPNTGAITCLSCPPSSGGNIQGATMITQCFIILPIDLLYFKAEIQIKIVWITWATSSEVDNDRFVIERSINGTDFSTNGEIKGAGTIITTTLYHYSDFAPAVGNNYYRLKQFDKDGKMKISQVRVVNYNTKNNLTVFTNLSANELIIQKNNNFPIRVQIYNTGGQMLIDRKSMLNSTHIDIATLSSGFYNVIVEMNGETYPNRFIK
jgi:Tyrosine-protein kinase ephrin type A/B receptor-like